jgi:hypothetical protein
MRGFQSKASKVRRALEQLSDAGIVESVRLAPVNHATSPPEGKVVVTVTVAGRSPEKRYHEIQGLVEQAGIADVALRFEHSGV